MLLKNRKILVTGCGKGIGKETVLSLQKEGAYVIAIIKSKKDNMHFSGIRNVKIYNGDVSNKNLIIKIYQDAKKKKIIIYVLVNNAGIRLRKNFLETSEQELYRVFNTNFFSIFFLIKIFCNNLIKKKKNGSVVNISSIVGQKGFSQLSAYASTKAALLGLTKSCAVEFAKNNIRFNSISPGFIRTSYYDKFRKKKNLYKWTLSRIPQKKWGDVHDISNMISFLLSDNASYITGENINIDGGWIAS